MDRPFAPGVAEAFAEAGHDMTGILPAAAPTGKATFLPGKARSEAFTLEWPVEVDGVTYEAILLQRLTAADVAGWQKQVSELPDGELLRFPIFRTVDGEPLPDAVLDGLDDDDRLRIDEAAINFLPRRFRGTALGDTAPASGDRTAP